MNKQTSFYIPTMRDIVNARAADVAVTPDATAALGAILNSTLRVKTEVGPSDAYKDLAVRQLLGKDKYREDLAGKGIRIIDPSRGGSSGEKKVFFHPGMVKRHLLSDTQFAQKNVRDYLLRIEGARKEKQRIGESQVHGVSLPLKTITGEDDR